MRQHATTSGGPRRRPGLALAVAPLVVLVLTACTPVGGRAGGDRAEGEGAARDGVLTVVGPLEVHSVDPATSSGFFTRLQVAETLVEADPEGVLQPGLADGWTGSADARSWSFRLRPDAVFHDGGPVTAEAAAAALDRARQEPGTPLATAPITAVRADGEAVRVDLAEPFAPLPAVLAHTSAQILAPSSYDADGSVTRVVGSGPYRVERLEQPSRVDLVASDTWRGEPPAVDRVSYQAVGRAESRALMAESGQADVTFGMDPTSLQRLERAGDLDVVSVTLPRTIQLKVNAGHPLLGEPRVRQALSLALDREAMATALLRDPEMAATQLFPPSLAEWHSDDLAPLAHDPERARALLAEAGWVPGEDGVLVRDGRPFAVTLRTFPDRPELPVLATAIQAALREVGVAVDVQVGNSSEIPAAHADGTLELALFARNFSLVPDPLVTLLGDFDPAGADFGAMGWSDPTLTAALQDMADGTDPAGAEAARERVAEVLQAELPVVPVAWYRQSALVGDRVHGLVLDPLERSWRLTDLRWAA